MDIVKTSEKRVVYGFDLLKFFMALMIIAIHSRAFCNPVIERFCYTWTRVSVPMFFVLSGSILFKKYRKDRTIGRTIVSKFCKRILLMYSFCFMLQLPLIIKEGGYIEVGFPKNLLLLFKSLTISHTFHGSWFLSALVISVCIVALMDKLWRGWIVGSFSVLMFLFNFERQLLPSTLSSLYNRLGNYLDIQINLTFLYGIIWVGLGYFLSHPGFDSLLQRIKPHYYAIAILGIYILDVMYMIRGDISVTIMVILLYCLFYSLPLNPNPIYLKLRNLSILFFLIHFLVCGFFHKAFPGTGWLYSGLIFYGIVLVITFCIAESILWLEKKNGFTWLKYSH